MRLQLCHEYEVDQERPPIHLRTHHQQIVFAGIRTMMVISRVLGDKFICLISQLSTQAFDDDDIVLKQMDWMQLNFHKIGIIKNNQIFNRNDK